MADEPSREQQIAEQIPHRARTIMEQIRAMVPANCEINTDEFVNTGGFGHILGVTNSTWWAVTWPIALQLAAMELQIEALTPDA